MPTTSVGARPPRHGGAGDPAHSTPVDDRGAAVDGAGSLDLFTPRFRRRYVLWVVATLPLAALAGLEATTPTRYVVLFVAVGALYILPALACAGLLARRA